MATKRSFLVLAVTILPIIANGQTVLSVEGTTEIGYSPDDGGSPNFTLTADFISEQVSSVTATVVSMQAPSERKLSLDACKVEPQTANNIANRATFVVTIASQILVRPGEYQCKVRFDGLKKDGNLILPAVSKDLKITRLEPGLTAASLQERTVRIVRPALFYFCIPFLDKCDLPRARLRLTESTRDSPIASLAVVAGTVVEAGTMRQGRGTATPNSTPYSLDAGGSKEIVIGLADFDSVGEFETELLFESPNFAASKSQKLKIEVSDFWLLPLLMILAGVCGGAWVNKFVKETRPAIEMQLDILTLRERLRRLRPSLENPVERDRFREIEEVLEEVERHISINSLQTAQTQLTSAITKLTALEKDILTALSQQHSRLAELRRDFADIERHPLFSATKLDQVAESLGKAESDLDARKPGSARVRIDDATSSIRRLCVGRHKELLGKLAALNLASTDEGLKAAMQISASIETALAPPSDPNAVADFTSTLASLEKFADKVDALESKQQSLGGRPTRQVAQVQAQARISVLTLPSERQAGRLIKFELHGLSPDTKPEPIKWAFGDGTEAAGEEVSHTYFRQGYYTVSADDGTSEVSLQVFVMPSTIAQKRNVLIETLQRKDWIVTVIAASLAALAGLTQLYVDQIFGTLDDYIVALLWGFGIERAVRGFSAVFAKVTA